mmetsp:Transcript_23265/g.66217  ORF Transcript_23265/g.66217 Transcript_23265/m.66217 type:complete len:700 (-) Transcript_23265:99-2198(-)
MAPLRPLLALAGLAFGGAVTPVEKVITLLEGIKTDVEAEGASEAQAYDTFSCWCRDTTKSKSDAILAGRDNINSLSAEIQEDTAEKEASEAELAERQAKQEAMAKDLQDTKARFEKAQAEYDVEAADMSKAIRSLESAIQAMESSKPASLLALRSSIESSLALARAMNLISEERRKDVRVFLQTRSTVDPSDPTYAYHSQGIIDTLKQLLVEFRSEKATLDEEWGKAKASYESTIKSLEDKMTENATAIDDLGTRIETLKGKIATARQALVSADAMLKDDQLYMKDMTERCELRAKDWDQRSQLRADELTALTQALAILTEKVTKLDEAANERALLQKAGPKAELVSVSPHAPAFLQEAMTSGRSGLRGAASAQARQEEIVVMLGQEGRRLRSTALSALAMHISADPFAKVKTLIQKLVERLLAEATAEATKKGFCDTELGKAKQDRTHRMEESHKLAGSIRVLDAKQEELELEIEQLAEAIETLQADLEDAAKIREEERKENLKAISQGKEGFNAVKQAILILKTFYAKGSRATVLVETKASPVDEGTEGPGFEGAYKGKQAASDGIIGMMEVLQSDFQRTIDTTTKEEEDASAKFVEYERASKADIAGKTTKKELDQEDLETTRKTIDSKMTDLKTAMDLLDSALKRIEELKPTCIDTGMSYSERVEKREQEMAALKRALCMLDSERIEPECTQQQR